MMSMVVPGGKVAFSGNVKRVYAKEGISHCGQQKVSLRKCPIYREERQLWRTVGPFSSPWSGKREGAAATTADTLCKRNTQYSCKRRLWKQDVREKTWQ